MRKPEPWLRKFRTGRGKPKRKPCWYVQIDRKQIRLHEDKSEAWRLYHDLMARGDLCDVSTVGHLLDHYLEWIKRNRSVRTLECYGSYIGSFLRHVGHSIRVRDLKPRHVTEWLGESKWCGTTKNIAVRSVKGAFAWAAREGIIARSPIAAVRAPEAARRERIITPDEWRRIMDAVPDQEFRDLLTVLRETGCRPHEARVLEARHVQGNCWVLPRGLSKGKKYCRVVRLNPTAKGIIDRLAEQHPIGPIFRNVGGNPWDRNAIVHRFQRLRKRLDGLDGVTAYAIRHTFATEALTRGVDAASVAVLMGHRDATMVLRVYQHVDQQPEHIRAALLKATEGSDTAA